jgi:hypothetical protein
MKKAVVLFLGSLMAMLTCVLPACAADITTGLVGWWKFDEGSGTQANDSSGNGNTGTIAGATWTAGKLGQALSFDGVNDAVDLGDNYDFPGQSFSVCAWANPDAGSNTGYIIGKYDGSQGLYLRVNPSDSTAWTVGVTTSSGIDGPGGSLVRGAWQLVCGVINPSGTSYLYKNGVSIGSLLNIQATADSAVSMTIGNRWDNQRQFAGAIDDVRIYNRALTAEDVAALYAAGNWSTFIGRGTKIGGGAIIR